MKDKIGNNAVVNETYEHMLALTQGGIERSRAAIAAFRFARDRLDGSALKAEYTVGRVLGMIYGHEVGLDYTIGHVQYEAEATFPICVQPNEETIETFKAFYLGNVNGPWQKIDMLEAEGAFNPAVIEILRRRIIEKALESAGWEL